MLVAPLHTAWLPVRLSVLGMLAGKAAQISSATLAPVSKAPCTVDGWLSLVASPAKNTLLLMGWANIWRLEVPLGGPELGYEPSIG